MEKGDRPRFPESEAREKGDRPNFSAEVQPQVQSAAPVAGATPTAGLDRVWGIADWVLIAGGLYVQLFCVLKGIWGDGSFRVNYLQQLLDQHTFSNFYYSYAGPIWALPLVAIDRALKNEYWLTMRYNVFVLVAGCAVM